MSTPSLRQTLGYENKRVVVSGCASGIGLSTARLLLELGAEVHGVDLKPPPFPLPNFVPIDLRDGAIIADAARQIGGPIAALFNCAGAPPGPVPLDVMKVNFLGTRLFTDLIAPTMTPSGAIVHVGSNGGLAWRDHLADIVSLLATTSFEAGVEWLQSRTTWPTHAYGFSKEAIIVWTMTSAQALIKRGVRVNCANPGAVATPMLEEIEKKTPTAIIDAVAAQIGRRSHADEQAWPLIFLNSPLSSYINGATLAVDGGFAAAQALGPIA